MQFDMKLFALVLCIGQADTPNTGSSQRPSLMRRPMTRADTKAELAKWKPMRQSHWTESLETR